MSDEQTQCTRCSALILAVTAQENVGLCVPCARGAREQIDAGKRRYLADKAFRESPFWLFWRRLLSTPFDLMSAPEQHYYLVNSFRGAVDNGGFQQFFVDGAVEHYAVLLDGLRAMGAKQSLAMLVEARKAIKIEAVPDDKVRDAIWDLRADPEIDQQLEALNQRFWTDPDGLWERLQDFGVAHGFYPQRWTEP